MARCGGPEGRRSALGDMLRLPTPRWGDSAAVEAPRACGTSFRAARGTSAAACTACEARTTIFIERWSRSSSTGRLSTVSLAVWGKMSTNIHSPSATMSGSELPLTAETCMTRPTRHADMTMSHMLNGETSYSPMQPRYAPVT